MPVDAGPDVLIDDGYRQPPQMPGRIDDRAEIHERHHQIRMATRITGGIHTERTLNGSDHRHGDRALDRSASVTDSPRRDHRAGNTRHAHCRCIFPHRAGDIAVRIDRFRCARRPRRKSFRPPGVVPLPGARRSPCDDGNRRHERHRDCFRPRSGAGRSRCPRQARAAVAVRQTRSAPICLASCNRDMMRVLRRSLRTALARASLVAGGLAEVWPLDSNRRRARRKSPHRNAPSETPAAPGSSLRSAPAALLE
jgi:hypothetical protein